MKDLLSNFLTVSIMLILAALIVLPESILLGAEIFVLLFSILIFFLANKKNISVFRKLCTYFGLLSAGLMGALLRSDLILLGKNMYGVTTIMGSILCDGNYIVGYTVICLFLFSSMYVSKSETMAIAKIPIREECENSIKLLKERVLRFYIKLRFLQFLFIFVFLQWEY